jgi:hypothetical protein
MIFDTKEVLPEDKFHAYKSHYTVSVEVAKRMAKRKIEDLPKPEYQEGSVVDKQEKINDIVPLIKEKKIKESKESKKSKKSIQKSIADFFSSTKPAEKAREQGSFRRAIVDLTTEDKGWVHDHKSIPSPRRFRFSFSDDMKQRIGNGQWLSDEEMHGAMGLIRRQFPAIGGLDDTVVLKTCDIMDKAEQCDNIYIVHEADEHWVCARYTCKRNIFLIYDSMEGTIVHRSTREQLEKVGYCGTESSMQSM